MDQTENNGILYQSIPNPKIRRRNRVWFNYDPISGVSSFINTKFKEKITKLSTSKDQIDSLLAIDFEIFHESS